MSAIKLHPFQVKPRSDKGNSQNYQKLCGETMISSGSDIVTSTMAGKDVLCHTGRLGKVKSYTLLRIASLQMDHIGRSQLYQVPISEAISLGQLTSQPSAHSLEQHVPICHICHMTVGGGSALFCLHSFSTFLHACVQIHLWMISLVECKELTIS